MKKCSLMLAAAVAGVAALADPFGAPPNATHAWGVHDDNRPGVKKISAPLGQIPSDAIVLFDGTKDSVEKNWCDKNGKPTKWTVDDAGDLISVKGAGYIFTKEKFADCQLHVEWASPKTVKGMGQGRGNSGVFLMGNYEIQVLDSYETDPDAPGGNKNPNYSDGQAGAIYGQNPPLVNPCRAPGEFNSYDIVFHPPKFDADGKVLEPATITLFFNGVLVQDGWKYDGPTGYRKRSTYGRVKGDTGLARSDRMPLAFQDHGNPVHYRNVWIREIPRPSDNVTHGDYYAKPEAVLAQRAETAAKLDAAFDEVWANEPLGRRLVEAWRICSYEKTPSRMNRVKKLEREYLAAIKGMKRKDDIRKFGPGERELKFYFTNLVNFGVMEKEDPVLAAINALK